MSLLNCRPVGLRLAACALMIAAGFVLSVLAFYPGFMSPDSLMQYHQAISLRFDDWHPPLMSALWALLNRLVPGPAGMLYFQLAMLWGGLAVWCWQYRQQQLVWLLPFIGILPWVLNYEGVLWKDIGMAYALLLMTGIAAGPVTAARFPAACVLFFYAVNLRYNAIIAAVPLLVLVVARWRPGLPRLRLAVAVIAVLATALVLGNVTSYRLLGAERTKPLNFIIVDDLAYLSLKERRSLLPDVSIGQIQACALRTISETRMLARKVCLQEFTDPERLMVADLKPVWFAAIWRNKLSYLQFRFAAFGFLLRAPDTAPFYYWQDGIDANKYGLVARPGAVSHQVAAGVKSSAEGLPFLFKPYWWMACASVLLASTVLLRSDRTVCTVQALLISAILYTLAYIPVTPMADLRYVYWSMLATTLSAVLFVIDRPSWRGSGRSTTVAMTLCAGAAVVAFPNLQRLASIDMDRVFLASLPGPATGSPEPQTRQHLSGAHGVYTITGPKPQLQVALPDGGIVPAEVHYVGFDFSCLDSQVEPTLRLLWWGDGQPDARDDQGVFVHGTHGLVLVPVQTLPNWRITTRIDRLRIDFFDFQSCTRIALRNVTMYR